MRNTITAAFLCLSMSASAQKDSLVCFTVSEAYEILDTLHSGIDHRRARVILSVMYAKQVGITRSLQTDVDSLKAWRSDDHQVTADALRVRDQAVSDAKFWQGKAKGKANRRGWVGWGLGLLTAFLGYLGAQELGR